MPVVSSYLLGPMDNIWIVGYITVARNLDNALTAQACGKVILLSLSQSRDIAHSYRIDIVLIRHAVSRVIHSVAQALLITITNINKNSNMDYWIINVHQEAAGNVRSHARKSGLNPVDQAACT